MKLIISIVLPLAVGMIGSVFTTPEIGAWYATLERPDIAPPNWVFGPVWTTLYVLMGIAAYLVWNKSLREKGVQVALSLFGIQLALNLAWSIIFFNLHAIGAALAEVIVLWLAILATIVAFGKVSKLAAWLLVPYLAWVTFAAYLTFQYWSLNG